MPAGALEALIRLSHAESTGALNDALRDARRELGSFASTMAPLLEGMAQRARETMRLRELAMLDEMTQAPNRRAFKLALDREVARSHRLGNQLAVLYVDLDGLKVINDQLGHAAGDEAIIATARACERAVRSTDMVARLGGDEFAVLLPDTDEAGAAIVCRRIREEIEASMIQGQRLRTSVGMAVMGGAQLNTDKLIERADAELYRDKQERKSSPELRAA